MSDEQKPPVRVTIVDINIPFQSIATFVFKVSAAVLTVAAAVGLACMVLYGAISLVAKS